VRKGANTIVGWGGRLIVGRKGQGSVREGSLDIELPQWAEKGDVKVVSQHIPHRDGPRTREGSRVNAKNTDRFTAADRACGERRFCQRVYAEA